ncbi:MAG: hypothetical protein AAF386_01395 [Pseudomonadota bacterium]
MTEATRQKIIATPIRHLSVELIKEYSNSAHDVSGDQDDIKAMLPRYLDLVSKDEEVDYNGMGTELVRFGNVIRTKPNWLTDAEQLAYCDWAQITLKAFVWEVAHDRDPMVYPLELAERFVCGGIQVARVLVWLDELLTDPQIGQGFLIHLCDHLTGRAKWKSDGPIKRNFYGLEYTDAATIAAWYTWLNSDAWAARLVDLDFGALSPDQAWAATNLIDMAGRFDPNATQPSPYRILPDKQG